MTFPARAAAEFAFWGAMETARRAGGRRRRGCRTRPVAPARRARPPADQQGAVGSVLDWPFRPWPPRAAQLIFCFKEISGLFSFSVASFSGVRIMRNAAKRLRSRRNKERRPPPRGFPENRIPNFFGRNPLKSNDSTK